MNSPCLIPLRIKPVQLVNVFGGYLDNPLSTSDCRYCRFAVGDQFFDPLNISFSNRWRDVFIIFAFFGGLLLF